MRKERKFLQGKGDVDTTMVFPNLTGRRPRKTGVEYSGSSTKTTMLKPSCDGEQSSQRPVTLGTVDRKIDTITS